MHSLFCNSSLDTLTKVKTAHPYEIANRYALVVKGRFYAKGWSCTFPDGCFLDTDPPSAYKCGISARNAAQDIRFDIFESDREPDMREQMRRYLFGDDNDGLEQDSQISETELNGMTGFEVFATATALITKSGLPCQRTGGSHSLPSVP